MKFTEKSYVNRCMDVVVGRSDNDVSLFIRVPSYADLPPKVRSEHKEMVEKFISDVFPDHTKVCEFNDTKLLKASFPDINALKDAVEKASEKYPELLKQPFPQEQEDDTLFRKSLEMWLKHVFCERSAAIYSDNSDMRERANAVSAKVFPKFPYPLKGTITITDADVVTINFPWLLYRFYAPLFENMANVLVSKLKAAVTEEPSPTKVTSSAWNKQLKIEGDEKHRAYASNLVHKGLDKLGIPHYFKGKDFDIDEPRLNGFIRAITTVEEKDTEKADVKEKRDIKDRVVPYNDKPLIYVQLFPETYEKVKDKVKEFAEEKGLKGGEFVEGGGGKYFRSYIIGSSKTMLGFENRLRLAKELADRIGVEVEASKAKVEVYVTKTKTNVLVCARMPKPWDKEVGNAVRKGEEANPISKALNALALDFQADQWEPVFSNPGFYVSTFATSFPKDAPAEEIENAKNEAKEKISKYPELECAFVDMREKRAAEVEREIQKNIRNIGVDIER